MNFGMEKPKAADVRHVNCTKTHKQKVGLDTQRCPSNKKKAPENLMLNGSVSGEKLSLPIGPVCTITDILWKKNTICLWRRDSNVPTLLVTFVRINLLLH